MHKLNLRVALELLTEARDLFRMYEADHRAKAADFAGTAAEYETISGSGTSPVSRQWREKESASKTKAERNADIATRIDQVLS